jgi:prepilin-type N-terminal cleavage/methylation domain-containing protein
VGSDCTGSDDGFTLAELLVVIVILGLLSTVTVFAVRGITDEGGEAACASELQNLVRAQESHRVLRGAYATEPDLVANGITVEESTLYDITVAADETYTISPAAVGSDCTASVSGGGPAAGPATTVAPGGPDRSTYAVSLASTSFGNFHGNTGGYQVTPDPGEPDEVVVFGDSEGELGWHDMINNPQPNTQRVTFVQIGGSTETSIRAAISQARNNGNTTVALYTADDPTSYIHDLILDEWTTNPQPTDRTFALLVTAPSAGTTLTDLLVQIG